MEWTTEDLTATAVFHSSVDYTITTHKEPWKITLQWLQWQPMSQNFSNIAAANLILDAALPSHSKHIETLHSDTLEGKRETPRCQREHQMEQ